MSPVLSCLRRRRSLLALATVAPLLAAAAPAVAADAPLRTINRDPAGLPAQYAFSAYVSDDGREVIGNMTGVGAVVRDVAAGSTRVLFPSALARAASHDGRYLLLETSTNGVIPGDADNDVDLFFYDRTSGTITHASRDLPNFLNGTRPDAWDRTARQLSGDGRFFTYEIRSRTFGTTATPGREERSLWRADRVTGRTVRLRALPVEPGEFVVPHRDAAGGVVIGGSTAFVGARRIALPVPPAPASLAGGAEVAISTGGQTIAVRPFALPRSVRLVSVATGEVTATIEVPADVALAELNLSDVSDDASAVWLRTREKPAVGVGRERVLRLSASGSATVLGDYPVYDGTGYGTLSQNHAFAATGQHLAQLADLPLPGTEPAASAPPTLDTWVGYRDVSCARNFWGQVSWIRATVNLASGPRGFDARTPSSMTVKAFKTGSPGTVYNQFTLAAGGERQLTVPNTGGWSIAGTVTFTDGSTSTGTIDVPVHPAPRC